MESISKFQTKKILSSQMIQLSGGRYQKTGCGEREVAGGARVSWKCDIKDDEGRKPTIYYGGEITEL